VALVWKWFWRITAWLFGAGVIAGIAAIVVAWAYVESLRDELPSTEALLSYQPKIISRIHAGDGTLIAEYAAERRIYVPYEAIPPYLVHAFVSAEDKNFFEHGGIDPEGIARALVNNVSNVIEGRRPEGASTITQQVAKNFLLSSDVTIKRKVKEMLVAREIERVLSKGEILELYLNEIYLGWRAYGVAAASLNYFNKSLDELTLAEAAYLAAMPKGPANYRPDRETQRARGLARRNWVLGRMAANGYISQATADRAQQEPLRVYEQPTSVRNFDWEYFAEEVRKRIVGDYGDDALVDGGLSVRTTLEPKMQAMAITALRDGLVAYDRRHGWRGPVAELEIAPNDPAWSEKLSQVDFAADLAPWRGAVVLSIDEAQNRAVIGLAPHPGDGKERDTVEAAPETSFIPLTELLWARPYLDSTSMGPEVERVSDVLKVGDAVYVEAVTGEDGARAHFTLRQVPQAQGGIIAMDPHTGRVLAMIGGFSFETSQFNRAVQALRQPGSSFKPFVYATAFDNGYTPVSLVLDAPFVLDQGEGKPLWKPDNYTTRFYGPSTLRLGMEKSRNLMTVRLAQDVGMEKVRETALRFGVVDSMPMHLSAALGAQETTLVRMTTAYAQFVNGGKKIEPIFIDRIQDRNGKTIFKSDQRACAECSVDEWTGQEPPELPDTREQVVDPRTAYQIVSLLEGVVERGTATTVRSVGKPLGGKTGTTNDYKDAWFVGFSPDLAVGIYVGFDTPTDMGRDATGGGVAAPIFRDFMAQALADAPSIPFRIPEGIRLVRVDPRTGARVTDPGQPHIVEAFKPGTEPRPGEQRTVLGGGSAEASQDDAEGKKDLKRGTGGLY